MACKSCEFKGYSESIAKRGSAEQLYVKVCPVCLDYDGLKLRLHAGPEVGEMRAQAWKNRRAHLGVIEGGGEKQVDYTAVPLHLLPGGKGTYGNS